MIINKMGLSAAPPIISRLIPAPSVLMMIGPGYALGIFI